VTRQRSAVLLVVALGAVALLAWTVGRDESGRPRPVVSGSTAATPSVSAPPTASASSDAGLARLVAACRAGTSLPYSGVQRVLVTGTGPARTSLVDVTHVPGGGVRLALRTSHGESGAFVGQLTGPSLLPVVDEAAIARMASRYTVTAPRPGARVAGRDTDVVDLVRSSGTARGSVAARFWLDHQTSLPLQREVLDGTGHVQQSSTYTSISYRPVAQVARFSTGTGTGVGTAPDPGRGVRPAQLDALRRNGWAAPAGLPDDFELVDARIHGTGASPQVLQLAYTDGISVVSVFEQRGRLDASALDGWRVQRHGSGVVHVDAGTPRRMAWSARGNVYTVVSDDLDGADSVMSALPAPTGNRGAFGRLQHGAARLVSWVDPFG
jgi:hypothetical protein